MNEDSGSARRRLAKLNAELSAGDGVVVRKQRLVGFLVPLALGAALTVGIYLIIAKRQQTDKAARFEEVVSEMASALQTNFDLQFETLHAIPPFFAASDHVSRGDFSAFVRPAMRRYPSIYVFQWLPRVTAADRGGFEALLRDEGYQGSGLREIVDAENARPAANRPEYFPVLYGEPAIQIVFGLDLASHPEQGPYYLRACTSESTVATPPLSLIEDPPDVLSVIALKAARLRGTNSDEPCDGLAMMILRVNPVVTRAIGQERLREVSVSLTAENSAGVLQPVFQNLPGGIAPGARPRWPEAAREISVSDQVWTLRASPAPGTPLAPGGSPWFVLVVGLLLSALAGYGVAAAVAITGLRKRVDAARRMGSYQLVSKLGEGGMGVVWRAKHKLLARPAAIKVIRKEFTAGPDGAVILARFEREVQATARLSSPHTIEVYDFGVTADRTFYYVMELLDGLDLDAWIERYATMEPGRVIRLMRQVCHSLAEAHNAGLVHRDIKPANIFLCRQGLDYDVAKVLDFGLVTEGVDAGGDERLTVVGWFYGTAGYAPPETARGETDAIDGRSDIYALGCVAYLLLTGRPVFEASEPLGLLIKHRTEIPDAPSAVAPQLVPAELDEVVLRCLEKEPTDRYESALQLADALLRLEVKFPWTQRQAREWWHQNLPEPVHHDDEVTEDVPQTAFVEPRVSAG
ncbi:MAG: CHASE domain-containing protein [Gemmatimonadetes bacterium]|nr:CHASE domain-containing protein [Gemmatimonadota bacterium]